MAAWLAAEPSSSSRPFSLVRSYSSRSAGPRLRAIRMALSGSSRWPGVVARQIAQQPVGQVLEVVQPLAQIGVARLAQAGAVLGAHPLDRRLGGQAGAHRLLQRPVPAAVVGEHAVGLEHLEGRRRPGLLAAVQHRVDLGLQAGDGRRAAGSPRPPRRRPAAVSGATGASCSTAHAVGQAVGEARALAAARAGAARSRRPCSSSWPPAARRRRPSRPAPWR